MKKIDTGWEDLRAPWLECDNFPEIIEKRVDLLDILDHQDIEYIAGNYGKFTHKLRCPFKAHADGNERTASMYLCSHENSFKCFGCNHSGGVINFTMLLLGMPLYETYKWLAEFAEISDISQLSSEVGAKRERHDPEKTTNFQALKIANLVREHLKLKKNTNDYNKWVDWADKRFKKLDSLLGTTEEKNWEVIGKYYMKLKNIIEGKNK